MKIQISLSRAKNLITLLAIITVYSCGDDDSSPSDPDNGQSNVRITEVDAVADEVTLQNFGDADADISGYWFCIRRGYTQFNINLTDAADLTLSPNETITFSIAVDNSSSDVSIYNQNGAFTSPAAMVDYMQFNGSFSSNGREDVAVSKGIWTAGEFVEGATTFTYDGDGTQNGADQWSGDNEAVPVPETFIRLVSIDPIDDLITIQNLSGEETDVSNYELCLGPGQYNTVSNYETITGDLLLSANESVIIDITSGTEDVTDLPDANGGLGLFANTNFTSSSADDLKDYVQWGAANSTRVGQAVDAGRWDDAANFVDGEAPYTYSGGTDDIGVNFWNSSATIRLTSINPDTESVTIKNLGGTDQDISAFEFCLGPGNYNSLSNYTTIAGDLVLSPDEEVTIDLTSSTEDVAALPASGALGLFKDASAFGSSDPDQLRDFVQWGAADGPRVGQAVTAGRWDDANNFINTGDPAPYIFTGSFDEFGSTVWGSEATARR